MLTFTRRAADSMKQRFWETQRPEAQQRFHANTYHGYALRCLLRTQHVV